MVVWDVRAEKEQIRLLNGATVKKKSAIDALALHPDGKWVYVIYDDREHLFSANPKGERREPR